MSPLEPDDPEILWGGQPAPDLPPGVRLLRTLRGHTNWIGRIAWSPDGTVLASPSADGKVRLVSVNSGRAIRTLRGYSGKVYCVAWAPSGRVLATGGEDHTIRLWHPESGDLVGSLEGHTYSVFSVAFDATGRTLASAASDGTARLWDIDSGQLIGVLAQDDELVGQVAFDRTSATLAVSCPNSETTFWDVASGELLEDLTALSISGNSASLDPGGRLLACACKDCALQFWDLANGKLISTHEGHTSPAKYIAHSTDGRLLASKGGPSDDSVRLWCSLTGACLAVIPEPSSVYWPASLAFHPNLPLLATVGSHPGTRPDTTSGGRRHRTTHSVRDRIVHIWELDVDLLLKLARPVTTYTSAKIVLVGESNVGKSYLAHRITTGTRPQTGEIQSTHGMKFWPLEPEQLCPTAKTPDGHRRDVVLWDMGGQEEYRLVHQLFLHDTTVALVLLDPTRGDTAFKEVETWNKYLDKQLKGRNAVKLLVGAKQDEPSAVVNRPALDRLLAECGFAGYIETSALTGRGIEELCEQASAAINWEQLGLTSRPELFQRIRDEIDARRKQGLVVLTVADLRQALTGTPSTEDEEKAVHAVTEQLATQGVIARSRFASGEPVLVLQVQEVERYAGALILAARNNPREVPALELKTLAQPDHPLPVLTAATRLPLREEQAVLECTVQLMVEHGLCFQHEGLLVFPSLFAPAPAAAETALSHAVSLYYDFAGAIDNIYASLVAWLVLAQNFGRVRLWADRAEFEVKDGGLCGLRKVSRPGGFAHVDVYFEAGTPRPRQELFISFVEEHLRHHGVEIREHIAITCPCGETLDEEVIRKRIARGDTDVRCPVCEERHSLAESAAEARKRDPGIQQKTWALKTEIEERRRQSAEAAVRALERTAAAPPPTGPLRLLHLSDLHFTGETPVPARLQWLLDDLKLPRKQGGLEIAELDYLVISGDFTDKAGPEGFDKAYEFVSGLTEAFGLSAERCIFVPGNHDVTDQVDAYTRRKDAQGLKEGEWFTEGRLIMARDPEKYPLRFKPFSDGFYHKFLQRPYPAGYAAQGLSIPFWETGIQFLTLNSAWQIDEFHRKRSGLHPEAVAHALRQAQDQERIALAAGHLRPGQPLLRIAVWHHAVTGHEKISDLQCLGHFPKLGVKLALHGDVHEMHRDLIGYPSAHGQLHVIGSGSFGAPGQDRPESTPRLYNVLEIARDLKSVKVHTREQRRPDGPWSGWREWPNPNDPESSVAYYDLQL